MVADQRDGLLAPSPDDRGRIVRTGRMQDTEDGLSEMPHVIINQARPQQYLLDYKRRLPTRLEADYGLEFVTLEVESDLEGHTGHPVVVTLRDVASGMHKMVRARYVAGCDGARSAVRESLGAVPHGDFANHAWVVAARPTRAGKLTAETLPGRPKKFPR